MKLEAGREELSEGGKLSQEGGKQQSENFCSGGSKDGRGWGSDNGRGWQLSADWSKRSLFTGTDERGKKQSGKQRGSA